MTGDRPPRLPADLCLEPMRAEDLDEVLAIESERFRSPWNRGHFLFELEQNPWAINRVARSGGQVLGYYCIWQLQHELKINNLAVDAKAARMGLGGWMLDRILAEARDGGCTTATLEVRPSNVAAVQLYLGRGFHEIGRRKGYYRREQEDAIVMERKFS